MLTNLEMSSPGFAHSSSNGRGTVFVYSTRLRVDDFVHAEAPNKQQHQGGRGEAESATRTKMIAAAKFRDEEMRKEDKLKVALFDDNHLFRSGLCELLTHCYDFNVIGAVGSIEEMRTLIMEQPDLLVMDIRMKPVDGLTALSQLRKAGCYTPAVILTMSDSELDFGMALRAGVRGYLLKDMEPDELVDAIRRIAAGEFVVAPPMTEKMIEVMRDDQHGEEPKNLLSLLTGRELEIMKLLSRGDSNKSIAQTLSISAETVKQHVHHIFTKLNMSSRVKAAILFAKELEKNEQ